MTLESTEPVRLHLQTEEWPRRIPARITGYTWNVTRVLTVALERNGAIGRAEASGIYYYDDTPDRMRAQLESLRSTIEAGVSRESIQQLLPPGGARNALDCAFWDLEAKLTGIPAWQRAGLPKPKPLVTTFTCHADTPEKMSAQARNFTSLRAVKLKLTGEPVDADRVRAVREALPDMWLSIDANQGFTRAFLEELMPTLVAARVALIEQPFRIGEEALLDGFAAPIPIAADESVQGLADIPSLVGRFNVVNIKLDKCGGLTEGLAMARAARERGLEVMVGNMGGTSLAMAPAFLVGQLCDVIDLDGPTFLKTDRDITVDYTDGTLFCPDRLWGGS
ncbi:dipeptide epimerase [Peristeroidobacter soli]|uniref:dipeptide epimerase n=1 Tax=Peristeroidobacter soli TaxID=2497877 RepID=UPI00101D5BD1|nr:dipeptide epimerase [Peristeroidobacter soli]